MADRITLTVCPFCGWEYTALNLRDFLPLSAEAMSVFIRSQADAFVVEWKTHNLKHVEQMVLM